MGLKAGLSDIVAPAPLVFDDKNRISARCKVLSVEFEITDCIFSWSVSRERFPQSFWQDKTEREGRRGGGGGSTCQKLVSVILQGINAQLTAEQQEL